VILTRSTSAIVLVAALMAVVPLAAAQGPPPRQASADSKVDPQVQAAEPDVPLVDVFDLLRQLRRKGEPPEEPVPWDPSKRMMAFAPIIGYKPTSGLMFGIGGNIARFLGDPGTTRISSAVISLTFSMKKQTALTGRYTAFTRDDRWRVEGDNRAQWTSQDAYGLGTGTVPADRINAKYNFFRVYETGYYRLRPNLFAGLGVHYNAHTDIRPGSGVADDDWQRSPYMTYTVDHGFPVDGQTSAGTSVNLLFDNRDSVINANRGVYLNTSYRTFFEDVLGGDSTWQELYLDARTYAPVTKGGRTKLAFWLFGDFVTGGYAPYLDLPATGMDTYGRSGRGYGEGRFRGERMLYGEVEYRAQLMRDGLLGMVVFLNVTTITNLETGERLFHTYAPGGGAGLRLLINKRSKTHLCLDVGFGKDGSRGVYLAVQEAF
jgi:outer membrane protein assembly factor BamA